MIRLRRKRTRGLFAPTVAATGWGESTFAEISWDKSRGAGVRWAAAGIVLGVLLALVAFAPAAWLAGSVASATGQRVLLADARGTVWNGSAVAVLTGGEGSRDASSLPGRLASAIGAMAPADQVALAKATPAGGADVLSDSSFISALPDALARPYLVSFSQSMDLVFISAAVVAAIGLVVVLFLPQLPLRTTSGLEAAAAERADEAAAARGA